MCNIVPREGPHFRGLGQSMDVIQWSRFTESMISDEILEVQAGCVTL